MRKYFLIAFILTVSSISYAQDSLRKNEVFLELGGNSLVTAINFQRGFFSTTGFGVRVGIGTYYFSRFTPVVPIGINYRFKTRGQNSYVDASLGLAYTTEPDVTLFAVRKIDVDNPPPEKFFYWTPSLSWIRHSKKSFLFRLSLAIVYSNVGTLPNLGISFGKKF